MTDTNSTQHRCKVTTRTKNKFSCLSSICLEHSWICEVHREENAPLLAAHLEELDTLCPSLMTHEHQEHKRTGPSPISRLIDSDMEDINWETITETSNNHPSDITLPLYRHLSVLPDTGNPHNLFSTRTPKTLYDTRIKARHQCTLGQHVDILEINSSGGQYTQNYP